MAKGKFDAAGNVIRGLVDESSLAAKLASDPRIQKVIAKNMGGMDPALAARIRAGDQSAALEAYQSIVASGGRLPARQMELALEDGPGTAMIPYGGRGPGVPGDLSGPGSMQNPGTGMIPAPLRGIPGSGPRRIGTTAGVPGDLSGPGVMQGDPAWNRFVDEWDNTRPFENSAANGLRMRPGLAERGLSTDVRLPRLTDENSFDAAAQRWADNMPDSSGVRTPPPGASAGWRSLAGAANSPTGRRVAAGAAAAGGGIAWNMFPREGDAPPVRGDLTDASGTADLAEESRPVPKVEPTAGEDAPPDYSYQARQLMNQLNALRRKAGGEVPESRAMMAEVNRLLSMSNNQRNAPEYKPAMPTDHHGEAQRLIQDLNARRAAEGGEVPDAPQVMAKVRQLQAMGDRMRNAG